MVVLFDRALSATNTDFEVVYRPGSFQHQPARAEPVSELRLSH